MASTIEQYADVAEGALKTVTEIGHARAECHKLVRLVLKKIPSNDVLATANFPKITTEEFKNLCIRKQCEQIVRAFYHTLAGALIKESARAQQAMREDPESAAAEFFALEEEPSPSTEQTENMLAVNETLSDSPVSPGDDEKTPQVDASDAARKILIRNEQRKREERKNPS